jgi:hypothetical protein
LTGAIVDRNVEKTRSRDADPGIDIFAGYEMGPTRTRA